MTVWWPKIDAQRIIDIALKAEYYDMLTLEPMPSTKPFGGYMAMLAKSLQLSDETTIVVYFRAVRKLLIDHNNDEKAAAQAIPGIMQLLEDLTAKSYREVFYDVSEFNEWLYIYKEVMTNIK